MEISVVIPTYNESTVIAKTVTELLSLHSDRNIIEVIVIDASPDGRTLQAVLSLPLVRAEKAVQSGRGNQMNQGAKIANGEVLVFLHADTSLPKDWDVFVEEKINAGSEYGGFLKRFDMSEAAFMQKIGLWLVQEFSNLKVRVGYEYLGDNAIFIKKEVFSNLGYFSEPMLMEDVAFSKLAREKGLRSGTILQKIVTSPRRFYKHGVLQTAWRMVKVRRAYKQGVRDQDLVAVYENKKRV